MPIQPYDIIYATDFGTLVEKVNASIKTDGMVPIGGVATAVNPDTTQIAFYQAMVTKPK